QTSFKRKEVLGLSISWAATRRNERGVKRSPRSRGIATESQRDQLPRAYDFPVLAFPSRPIGAKLIPRFRCDSGDLLSPFRICIKPCPYANLRHTFHERSYTFKSGIIREATVAETVQAKAPETKFQPYVPAEEIRPEFTARAIIFGGLFGILFGAVTVYV